MKQEISQYCRICQTEKRFYFIGVQETYRGDDLPLYNCRDCENTQIDSNRDNESRLKELVRNGKP